MKSFKIEKEILNITKCRIEEILKDELRGALDGVLCQLDSTIRHRSGRFFYSKVFLHYAWVLGKRFSIEYLLQLNNEK